MILGKGCFIRLSMNQKNDLKTKKPHSKEGGVLYGRYVSVSPSKKYVRRLKGLKSRKVWLFSPGYAEKITRIDLTEERTRV